MSTFIEQIHEKAKRAPKKVVLQEGEDARVIGADGKTAKLSCSAKGSAKHVRAKGSPAAGKANVLIFQDLDSGDISYKLTEPLAKAQALGPAKPSSDLSRGCNANDILNVIAINVVRLQFAQK
jgi:phosphotransacetylase